MNTKFMKLAALLLSAALLLCACGANYEKQAEKQMAELDKLFTKVVATYDGGEVALGEVVTDFYARYNQMAYFYQLYGMQLAQEDVHSLIEASLEYGVRAEVVGAKYDAEHGLSEERLAEIAEEAQLTYDSNYEALLETMEGKDDEERAVNARMTLYTMGLSPEGIHNTLLGSVKLAEMETLLQAEITEISEEELQAAYEAKLAQQQESFNNGSSFESAMNSDSEVICWQPDGYRAVKHILFIPASDLMAAYNEALLGDDAAALEEARAACFADVQAKLDEAYAKLNAGEKFEDVMEAYGEDPGMKREPTKTRGYMVSKESIQWQAEFRDGAMALNQVGQYSAEPVLSGSGVHIIYYAADVLGGQVPLEQVKEALYAEALADAQAAHATATIDGWVAAVNPVYDVEGFESVLVTP